MSPRSHYYLCMAIQAVALTTIMLAGILAIGSVGNTQGSKPHKAVAFGIVLIVWFAWTFFNRVITRGLLRLTPCPDCGGGLYRERIRRSKNRFIIYHCCVCGWSWEKMASDGRDNASNAGP